MSWNSVPVRSGGLVEWEVAGNFKGLERICSVCVCSMELMCSLEVRMLALCV